MNTPREHCGRCGESIRFLRMGNSAKWVGDTPNSDHSHSPYKPIMAGESEYRWNTHTMDFEKVK